MERGIVNPVVQHPDAYGAANVVRLPVAAKFQVMGAAELGGFQTGAANTQSFAASTSGQDAVSKPERGASMAAGNAPTREEIDAKLATVEARAETRFAELNGKLDRITDSISNLSDAVKVIRTEVKEDASFTRWTIGIVLISSLLAFAGAIWTAQSTILAAFQTGLSLHAEQQAAEKTPPSKQ